MTKKKTKNTNNLWDNYLKQLDSFAEKQILMASFFYFLLCTLSR